MSKNINKIRSKDIKIAYDQNEGFILGSIKINAPIDDVFQSLTSKDIINWWIRPDVFDTSEWTGNVQVGGNWKSSGSFKGQFYSLKGQYLKIERPHKIIHTYGEGNPWGPTTVTYKLESSNNNTKLFLLHEDFKEKNACEANALGWRTCFEHLKILLEKKG